MSYYSEYNDLFTEYTIEECREDLTKVVAYFKTMPYYEEAIEVFMCLERRLTKEIAEDADVFFIDDQTTIGELPEWVKSEPLGIVSRYNYVSQAGRVVYPIKDSKGEVMGFCGWDKFENPKYLDSRNYGYTAKSTTVYGMEKLEEYYSNNKPVFITEGIVCCLYLRSKGFQALALLGSSLSSYVKVILNRFGDRLRVIPDNDGAGDGLVKSVKWNIPKATILQVKYGKDIDGCRLEEDGKYEEELLKDLNNSTNIFAPLTMFIRR